MQIEHVFSAIIFFIIMLYFIYTRFNKKIISERTFTVWFIIIVIASFGILFSNRIIKLKIFSSEIELSEIKKIQKDIYAKQKDFNKLTEIFIKVATYNITNMGRLGGAETSELLKNRDVFINILKDGKYDANLLEEIKGIYDKRILTGLKKDICNAVYELIKDKEVDVVRIYNESESIVEFYELNKTAKILREYLKRNNIYSKKIEKNIISLEKYIAQIKMK